MSDAIHPDDSLEIIVHVTAAENEALSELAGHLRMTVSDLVRRTIVTLSEVADAVSPAKRKFAS